MHMVSCASSIDVPQLETGNFYTMFLIQSDVAFWQGYGPALAFVPATISVKTLFEAAHYVSNGNSKLPMTIQVLDQAGSLISSGGSQTASIA